MLKSRQLAVDLCPQASQSDRAHGVRRLQHKYWKCPGVNWLVETWCYSEISWVRLVYNGQFLTYSLFCKTASDRSINISVQCFPQETYIFSCWGGKASETASRPRDIKPPSKLILSGGDQWSEKHRFSQIRQHAAAARPSCYWWLLWLACRERWISFIKIRKRSSRRTT